MTLLATLAIATNVASAAIGLADPAFGTGGVVSFSPFKLGESHVNDALVDSDGHVVFAATEAFSRGVSAAAVVRLNADGSIDRTFGSKGVYRIGATVDSQLRAQHSVEAARLYALPHGKLLLVGTWDTFAEAPRAGVEEFMAVRLDRNGLPDKSFGKRGVAIVPAPPASGLNRATGAAILKHGSVAIAGSVLRVGKQTREVAALAKLTPSGRLDRSFGKQGWASFSVGGSSTLSVAEDVAATARGGFVIAGSQSPRRKRHASAMLVRLDRHGRRVAAFGKSGVVTLDRLRKSGLFNSNVFYRVRVDSRGVLAVGSLASIRRTGKPATTPAAARFTANGALDPTFGSGGVTKLDATPFPEAPETAVRGFWMADDGSGGTLISGEFGDEGWNSKCSLLHIDTAGNQDSSFGSDGDACAETLWYGNPIVNKYGAGRPGIGPVVVDPRGGLVMVVTGHDPTKSNPAPVNIVRLR